MIKMISKISFLAVATLMPVSVLAREGGFFEGADYSFVWNMFPAWIYLAGAIVLLTLALKHMAGGSLSKPFVLIGFGVLIDALGQISTSLIAIGLISKPAIYYQILLGLSLFFRFTVVAGVLWIAQIFGVLKSRR